MSDMKKLLRSIPQVGKVDFISIRSERKILPAVLESVHISIENGLEGDHYKGSSRKRQVTLIQAEHLKAVASLLEKNTIDPLLTRRNIVVSGVNLLAFKNMQFQIGEDVILEMTGACHPCSQMETNFGEGGYNAMRGHGGITAKVIHGGEIKIGDKIKLV
ncbi:MAG: MOSC domain-containing protein [Saprospiraceae bacterium]